VWVGDFEDGPYVMVRRRAVETHPPVHRLHSRYNRRGPLYYLRENLDILIDSLLAGLVRARGQSRAVLDKTPKNLFTAHALRRACCALNIRLLHRGVGDPPPGGLIERFFRTAQDNWKPRSGPAAAHAGPAEPGPDGVAGGELPRNTSTAKPGRHPAPLMSKAAPSSPRRLAAGAEVLPAGGKHAGSIPPTPMWRLDGFFFRVDPQLRGDRIEGAVTTRLPNWKRSISTLWRRILGLGQRYQREGPATQPPPASPPGKPQYDYVQLLIQKHERVAAATQLRHRLPSRAGPRPTPLALRRIRQTTAAYLGQAGGLSAFRTDELETLQKVYARLTRLDANLLERACSRARQRTIPEIVVSVTATP